MNWKEMFFGNPEKQNLRSVKTGIFFLLIFIAYILIADFIIFSIIDFRENGLIQVPVLIHTNQVANLEQIIITKYGNYNPATGLLDYKAINFWQIMLFKQTNDIDVFRGIYFLIIFSYALFSVNTISETHAFRKEIYNTVQFSGIFTVVFFGVILQIINNFKKLNLLSETGNMFEFNAPPIQLSFFLMGLFIISLGYFIKKGMELQQEKDLTI